MFNFEGGFCFLIAIGTLITLLATHCPSWNYWKACDRASYGFCPLILIGVVAAIYRHDVLFFLIPVGCTALGIASVAIRSSLSNEDDSSSVLNSSGITQPPGANWPFTYQKAADGEEEYESIF